MKKRTTGLLVLLTSCIIICSVIVFVVIPRTAALTIPYRWGNVPLRQPRTILLQYLGRPADTLNNLTDTWIAKREKSDYELKVIYTSDTISTSYKLYFNYRLGFFHKQYLLQEK